MTRPSEPPDATVRYAEHDDGVIDVHLPPAGQGSGRPLVFYVHGGFWRQGWDRRHARPLANALSALGYAVAVPEYRRVGGAGGWPVTAEDVEAALRAAPALLAGIGAPTTTTTIVVGHSAGGHLALWLANQLPGDIERVVALAPVGDLRGAAARGLGDGATVELLGGTPEQVPDRYDAADPGTRMATRPTCRVIVLHGDRDEAVPVQVSRGLKERFDWLDYRELAGADHSALIDPLSPAWTSVRGAVTG